MRIQHDLKSLTHNNKFAIRLGRKKHSSAFVIMCNASIIHELILIVGPAYTDSICGPDAQNQLMYYAYTRSPLNGHVATMASKVRVFPKPTRG